MQMREDYKFFDAFKGYKVQILIMLLLVGGLFYSIIPPMVMQWYNDSNYSHGFIVPIIAAYFLYQRRDNLKNALVLPNSSLGLFIIIFGLLLLAIAFTGSEAFTMRCSLIIILGGIVLYFFGKEVFKVISFPLGYLFFMIPLPYIIYNSIAVPLKLFITKYSVLFLKAVGITVWREGNIIMLCNTMLEVSDDCSGIRSLMSLLALSVAFAFYFQDTILKRFAVILSVIPIVIFANGGRIIVTGILAQYISAKAAEGVYHEFTGVVIFILALVILIITGSLINKIGK